jgi:hypothetical protein
MGADGGLTPCNAMQPRGTHGACLACGFKAGLGVRIFAFVASGIFMSLRICILETDVLRPELVDQYQGYGRMFESLFSRQPIPAEFVVYNVMQGDYPPADERFDAYLITGSKADSFGTDPWIQTLKTYLLERYTVATNYWVCVSVISCWHCCWAARPSARLRAGASVSTITTWRQPSHG